MKSHLRIARILFQEWITTCTSSSVTLRGSSFLPTTAASTRHSDVIGGGETLSRSYRPQQPIYRQFCSSSLLSRSRRPQFRAQTLPRHAKSIATTEEAMEEEVEEDDDDDDVVVEMAAKESSKRFVEGRDDDLFSREFKPFDELKKKLGKKGKKGEKIELKPALQPSFTFAGSINSSPLLTKLVHLGVDLVKWEKATIPDEIMLMSFDRDVEPVLRRFREIGIREEDFGQILGKNPYLLIFGHGLFEEKTEYFLRKKFSREQLGAIVKKSPQLFSRSIEAIDGRLGFFQKTFNLTGDQVRDVVALHPDLMQFRLSDVQKHAFNMVKLYGFHRNEVRVLFTTVPSIFQLRHNHLEKRFHFLHNTMLVPHQTLVKFPYLLKVPLIVVMQRHKFLKTLGKHVYDPLEDRYTSLTAFTNYDDKKFAEEIAAVDYEAYKGFLKTT